MAGAFPSMSSSVPSTGPQARFAPGGLVARRLAIVLLLVVVDLWSKEAVFGWLRTLAEEGHLVSDPCGRGHMRVPLLGEWLAFMLTLNPGAAFGHFDEFPHLLVWGRMGACIFLLWLIVRAPSGRRWNTAALLLVFAGALGNLWDNLVRVRDLPLDDWYRDHPYGPVRDFIDVYFGAIPWHFPTFNVADSCITVGAVLLILTGFGGKRAPAEGRA